MTSEWQFKSWESDGLKCGAEGRVRAGVLDHIRDQLKAHFAFLKETFSNRRSVHYVPCSVIVKPSVVLVMNIR